MNPLAVVIPSKTSSNLIPCVGAVRKHDPGARIIVIDDGLDSLPDGIDTIVLGVKPFIFARACNSGIKAAGNADVVLLNDDALLQSAGGFGLLQRATEEHPEYGVIGAVTNLTGQPLQRPRGKGLREVQRIAFVCVLIPRRTIERVGLLDERFTAYGSEDDDLCMRVHLAGLKVGVLDGCMVDHGSLRSTFRGDPKAPGDCEDGRRIFREKWGRLP